MSLFSLAQSYMLCLKKMLTNACTRTAKSAAPRSSSLCFLLPVMRGVRHKIIIRKGSTMKQCGLIFTGIISILLLSSCAAVSKNNLAEDPFNALGGGGGYLVNEVEEGTFEIEGRTNGTLLENYDAAREMWETQANNVCPEGYEEKNIKEYTFSQAGTGSLSFGIDLSQHTVKKGLAVCK